MAKVHFKKDTTDSFFGNFLYEQILPKNHFLVVARSLLPWEEFNLKLLPHYKGGAEYGRSPYDPSKILRMLFLSFLYGISERDTEEFVSLNLAAKYFVDLGVDEKAPDHSSLTRFKDRIVKSTGIKGYEAIFNEMIRLALEKGVSFGSIQIVDSVHTVANVNVKKDEERKKGGGEKRDKDASWGVKGTKKVKDSDGTLKEVKETFYGYKTHAAKNADSGLVTSLTVTNGSAPDNEQFTKLVYKDKKLKILKTGDWKVKDNIPSLEGGTAYTADKAYDDTDLHEFLKVNNLQSAIILKSTRINSRQEDNNKVWQDFMKRDIYQIATKKRRSIEPVFGTAKTKHNFSRCRYIGRTKMAVQSYLTFTVLNLMRIVKILTGTPFRGSMAYVQTGG